MTTSIVAQKAPYAQAVDAGKTYYWCACGRSANQPFCDGSHKAVGMAPIAVHGAKERDRLVLRLQADQERAPLRRDPPEPVSGGQEPSATGLNRNSEPFLVLRSRANPLILRSNAKHCVSKDGPAGVRAGPHWSVLRDAALRTAPQDEGVGRPRDE